MGQVWKDFFSRRKRCIIKKIPEITGNDTTEKGGKMQAFDEFMDVVKKVRENCPWDSVQTHESLKPYIVNETNEVLEGIDILSRDKDWENLCEELGDVLFQVALHSVIAQEEGLFTIEDVISGISSKMQFRHPKIFSPDDKEAAALSWEELKAKEKAEKRKSHEECRKCPFS